MDIKAQEKLRFALIIAELAFKHAEKGNNLESTLGYIAGVVNNSQGDKDG